MRSGIKIIGFDADDTLWDNETLFQAVEARYCALLAAIAPEREISAALFRTEMAHLNIYGFGVKSFTLSMLETALCLGGDRLPAATLTQIIRLGQELLQAPVTLLPCVENVLQQLRRCYRLVLATKGDLIDQERKLACSGLADYFHHIEIMSDKRDDDYRKLFRHLDVVPSEFLMVGNSLKSDILPVLQLGGQAVYIPYHVTWKHEAEGLENVDGFSFPRLDALTELPALLDSRNQG